MTCTDVMTDGVEFVMHCHRHNTQEVPSEIDDIAIWYVNKGMPCNEGT